VPFAEIARIVDRSPAAARQLASRARRRVRLEENVPDADLETQRRVVAAFLEAARGGDFDRLIQVLAPEAVLRSDVGPAGSGRVEGAEAIARQAMNFARLGLATELVRINGAVGVLTRRGGELLSIAAFVVRRGRVTAMDVLADPERVHRLDLSLIE
jgi:RNA polymerase sigma-70 factor (ECF subfamily)